MFCVLCASATLLACASSASPHRHRHHHVHVHRTRTRAPTVHVAPREEVRVVETVGERGGTGVGVREETITVNGVERQYLLSVPEGYRSEGDAVPLVFAYHGLTGTPRSLRSYLRVERESAGRAIFVYPAGIREASRRHPGGTTHWDVHPTGRDVVFFDALLEHLSHTYHINTSQVFVVGHSAGAVMTNVIGCARGRVLRAVAPIAGMGPYARVCENVPSVMVVHGHADEQVAFHFGEQTRNRWITDAHCDAEPTPVEGTSCVRYNHCSDGHRIEFCTHDGDHSVPAEMSREVWRFFASYL
jgi:polyhydroxybutyrate depolymerase